MTNILENPDVADLYARTGMPSPKFAFLVGASDNYAKMLSAKALAGSITKLLIKQGIHDAKTGFIEVKVTDIDNIEEIFKQAKAHAPCVIFIDDFHLLGTNKLLVEIDKIEQNNDPMQRIFIVAATDHPDLLIKKFFRHACIYFI